VGSAYFINLGADWQLGSILMKLYKLFLWLLGIVTLLDIIITLILFKIHTVDTETFPLYVLGCPLWVIILIKVIAIGYIIYWCNKNYHRAHIFFRYFIVYCVVLAGIIGIGIVINNSKGLTIPSEDLVQVPDDAKIEYYTEQILDLGVVKPSQEIPAMLYIIPINLLQFVVWRSFEKWKIRSDFQNSKVYKGVLISRTL